MFSDPAVLDLYCGGGGAAKGYSEAGFTVIGVDSVPQPHYPYRFVQYDALAYLRGMIRDRIGGWTIAAIHASPPCQADSITRHIRPENRTRYPRLITPTRELCLELGLPFVIENVVQSELEDPVILCGTQFGRFADWRGDKVALKRHRGFEAHGFVIPDAGAHTCQRMRCATVAGHGQFGRGANYEQDPYWAGKGYAKLCRELMGIDWLPRDELNEAIPPAYTSYVGQHLMEAIRSV